MAEFYNNYDNLKKDTLAMVGYIMDIARFSQGVDINIHLRTDEVSTVTYTVREATIIATD